MNGLLIIDKPAGMTSHDVVAVVRRMSGERSVGHMGTLDPMATGVLPLMLGRYTRLAKFFQNDRKAYDGTIRFGFATDTYDADGERVGEAATSLPGEAEIRAAAAGFAGEIEQMPPAYSAKKVDGVAAYKLARAGKPVELKSVQVTVFNFAISGVAGDAACFEIELSAGGYVRSVAHDLGVRLGCGAHLATLRRTVAGDFSLKDAVTLDDLARLASSGETIASRLYHPRLMLPMMSCVTVDERTAGRIRNGMQVNLPEYSSAAQAKIFTAQRDLLAIGQRIAGTLFQPVVVLG
jgi:tRNA pseudouridine55 synthase